MDGVCVDFVNAAFKLHGEEYDPANYVKGMYSIERMLCCTTDTFWQPIDAECSDFWRKLEPYRWFDNLYTKLCEQGEVYFTTAPSRSPFSALGKLQWLQDRFGRKFNQYFIGIHKQLFARLGSILIDDSDENVKAFQKAGGTAILFPQPWNSRHDETSNRVHDTLGKVIYTKAELRRITE